MKALFLAGRIAFGGFFVYNGVHHFLKWRSMAQYARVMEIARKRLAA